MKKIIAILLFIVFSLTAYTQDELNARVELENAESALNEENYEKALSHLNKTQEHLGSWSGRISYLKIIALDALCDYEKTDNSILPLLETEVGLYKEYAKKNPDKIDIDKYREITAVEGRIILTEKIKTGYRVPELDMLDKLINAGYNPKYNAERINVLTNLSEKGFASKMYMLGVLLYQGGIPEKSPEAGVKWVYKAAQKGDMNAMNAIASLYYQGEYYPKNIAEAIKWYEKAADREHRNSIQMLYSIYCKGEGGQNGVTDAVKWLENKINNGSKQAMLVMATAYDNGEGVPKNYMEALKWYKKMAETGDRVSMFYLGGLYDKGDKIPQDYNEAIKWYKKAAEKEDAMAAFILGQMYVSGTKGVSQDFEEADKWFEIWVNDRVRNYNDIYNYYKSGDRLPKSGKEAAKWARKGAEKGDGTSMFNLGTMYEEGNGVSTDIDEALKWYNSAAKKESWTAMERIGYFHFSGKGVNKDKNTAVLWFAKSIRTLKSMGATPELLENYTNLLKVKYGLMDSDLK